MVSSKQPQNTHIPMRRFRRDAETACWGVYFKLRPPADSTKAFVPGLVEIWPALPVVVRGVGPLRAVGKLSVTPNIQHILANDTRGKHLTTLLQMCLQFKDAKTQPAALRRDPLNQPAKVISQLFKDPEKASSSASWWDHVLVPSSLARGLPPPQNHFARNSKNTGCSGGGFAV